MDDELQEVRDNFMVGNYTKALQLAEETSVSSDIAQGEKDAILARCCLALQEYNRLKSMQNSAVPGQRAAAMTAVLTMSKNEGQKQTAKERLLELAKESHDLSTNILAASVLALGGDNAEAIALTANHPTLEMQALRVYLFLRINRTDLAERQLRDMSRTNDDSAAYRLAQAAVHLGTGNAEEAYLTYSDLGAQFDQGEESNSVLLLNGKAVANMQRGLFSEAVEDLQRALVLAPNDPEVLSNLCCCATHLAQKDEFQTHYKKLEAVSPTHPHVVKTQAIKNAFAKFSA